MSKFSFSLSYKDCCIIKHGLKNSIESKEEWIKANSDGVETLEEEKKEVEEEKRALERLTQQIEWEKENNHMKAR